MNARQGMQHSVIKMQAATYAMRRRQVAPADLTEAEIWAYEEGAKKWADKAAELIQGINAMLGDIPVFDVHDPKNPREKLRELIKTFDNAE